MGDPRIVVELDSTGMTPRLGRALSELMLALGNVKVQPAPSISRRKAPATNGTPPSWSEFRVGLSATHHRILDALEEHKHMSSKDLIAYMDMPGKAVGGALGSMGRKAVNRGVITPYRKTGAPGRVAWIWTGEGL